jgi:hypothetical protein
VVVHVDEPRQEGLAPEIDDLGVPDAWGCTSDGGEPSVSHQHGGLGHQLLASGQEHPGVDEQRRGHRQRPPLVDRS